MQHLNFRKLACTYSIFGYLIIAICYEVSDKHYGYFLFC